MSSDNAQQVASETPVKASRKTLISRASSAEHALFNIGNDWMSFFAGLESEDDMEPEVYEARVAELIGNTNESIDRSCAVLRQLEAQEKYLKLEMDRISEKRKRAQAHAAAIKAGLLGVVKGMGGSVRTQQNNLGIGKSESVRLREGFDVMPEFGKVETVFSAKLAEQILDTDPAHAAELGIVRVYSEHLTRK